MSSERLEDLYHKYVRNECSAEELERFLGQVGDENQPLSEERLFELFDKTWREMDVYPGQFGLPVQRVPGELLPQQGRVVSLRPWVRYAAAAALLLVVGLTTFLWVGRKQGPQVAQEQRLPQDIAPGRDRAILTLADGRQVVLDSTTGKVASEGGVTVINLNGQLAYTPSQAGEQVRYHTLSVPRGGQYRMVLADGTKVWLNAASSLRFPSAFAGGERVVELSGEGYFEVAHNARQPFLVRVGTTQVQVLGTHFNINSFGDEPVVKTTLLQGSVRVSLAAGPSDGVPAASVVLRPGEQAQLDSGPGAAARIRVVREVDTEAVLAWKNGWFEFENTDLRAILRQVSRWYDIDVVYRGTPGAEAFGGRISKDLPLSRILESLQSSGVRFELRGRVLTVTQ